MIMSLQSCPGVVDLEVHLVVQGDVIRIRNHHA